MNYYEHHLGDYMRDTAHLSMVEDCAYRRLLDAYYIREKPLPADLNECCKLARAATKIERNAVAYVLREFFKPDDDGQHQRRADTEIARFQDKQRKAKASADARWSHTERNANASPNAMRTQCERNADGMHRAPVPSPQSPDTSNTPTLTGGPPLPAKAKPNPKKTVIPPDFGISARVRDWASDKGFGQLEEHLGAFRRKVAANGYRYADWDAAFMEAVREDWAKLRGRTVNGSAPPAASDTSHNPDFERTQELLRRQSEVSARSTPPPPEVLALRSRPRQAA